MAYRPYYFARLRQAVGPNRTLLANSGPPFGPDPSLNGLAIEAESCHPHHKAEGAVDAARSLGNCAKAFIGQRLVSPLPALSVYWHTQVQIVNVSQQCADVAALSKALGGQLIEGIDEIDETWTSNGTACPGLT